MTSLFPWLVEPWRLLSAHRTAGRIPQGLVIHGPAGIGKQQLADAFARRLLCAGPGDYACGHCASCRLMAAGTHPDYIRLEPPEPGKAIPVDAIRRLRDELSLKAQYGVHRIVVIAPAHAMNINAANSLLKTLEEPAPGTCILLLTDRHTLLPATVLSRCQRLPVPPPKPEDAVRWLETERPGCDGRVLLAVAGGAPLAALALADSRAMERRRQVFDDLAELAFEPREEPALVAERWLKDDLDETLRWLLSFTADLIRLKAATVDTPLRNPDLRDGLRRLTGGLHLPDAVDHWSLILESRRALSTQANRQLLLEECLIRWSELYRPH